MECSNQCRYLEYYNGTPFVLWRTDSAPSAVYTLTNNLKHLPSTKLRPPQLSSAKAVPEPVEGGCSPTDGKSIKIQVQ